MLLSDFLDRLKLEIPNIKTPGISDTYLTKLLNQACDKTNLICKGYKGYTDFNISAEQRIYSLSSVVPTYLGTDKRGLKFKDSSDDWVDTIIPKTEDYIASKFKGYLNATSVAIPSHYWIDGDDLGFYPPPSTSKTSGCRLYHLKKATAMTDSSHYPFSGSAVQIGALLPMDEAIISWVKWKVSPSYGANTDADLGRQRWLLDCAEARRKMKTRDDIYIDSTYGVKI